MSYWQAWVTASLVKLGLVALYSGAAVAGDPEIIDVVSRTAPACELKSEQYKIADCEGVWAIEANIYVKSDAILFASNPVCRSEIAKYTYILDNSLQNIYSSKLRNFSGSLSQVLGSPLGKEIAPSYLSDLKNALQKARISGDSCVPIIVFIPVDAVVVGFRFFASDYSGFLQCNPGMDCPIGWSKFLDYPEKKLGNNHQIVTAIFMNWSHNRDRQAKMVIYYRMPIGNRPFTEL